MTLTDTLHTASRLTGTEQDGLVWLLIAVLTILSAITWTFGHWLVARIDGHALASEHMELRLRNIIQPIQTGLDSFKEDTKSELEVIRLAVTRVNPDIRFDR